MSQHDSSETSPTSADPTKPSRSNQSRLSNVPGTVRAWRYRLANRWPRIAAHLIVPFVVIAGLVGLVALAQHQGWLPNGSSENAAGSTADSDGASERYICPMMCTPPSSKPGRCPVCGMELVPATNASGGDGVSVTISPVARRLVGIQTAKAKLAPVTQTLRTVGSIEYDESRLASISAYVAGRIDKLYANYVGVPVQENDDLALLYSPELYSAQTEYLTAVQGKGLSRLGGTQDLTDIARQNLIELGLTEQQIAEVRQRGEPQSRVRIKSPIGGTVVGKSVVEGDYVKTGDPLFRVADLSTVWLMLDLFPDDASRVRFGQKVEAEVKSIPGETFTGRIAFIDPTVDSKTRTVRVRVEMLNTDGRLRPGEYASAQIFVPAVRQKTVYDPALAGKYISPMHPQVISDQPGDCPICGMDLISTTKLGYAEEPVPEQTVVTVPREAILMAGDRSAAYVETEPGRFEVRRVIIGSMTDEEAIILEGISPGESVATAGNFLIDSQMQLAGNPSLMDPSKAPLYAKGPLEIKPEETVVLPQDSGRQFDRLLNHYFEIQRTLAADQQPPAPAVDALGEALDGVLASDEVPNEVKSHLQRARRHVPRLQGAIDEARRGFRPISHALLRAANQVRGPQSAESLVHMFCHMVPGGGGDWMQPGGELVNPYWGAEMLHCGETIRDMAVTPADTNSPDANMELH